MFRCHQLGGHLGQDAGPASHRILNTNFAFLKPKFRKNILKTHRPVIDLKRPFYSIPLLLNSLSLYLPNLSVFVARMFYMRTPFDVCWRHLFVLNATHIVLLHMEVSKDTRRGFYAIRFVNLSSFYFFKCCRSSAFYLCSLLLKANNLYINIQCGIK